MIVMLGWMFTQKEKAKASCRNHNISPQVLKPAIKIMSLSPAPPNYVRPCHSTPHKFSQKETKCKYPMLAFHSGSNIRNSSIFDITQQYKMQKWNQAIVYINESVHSLESSMLPFYLNRSYQDLL
jgi:hypothetical protein